jgi:hypothetical protein
MIAMNRDQPLITMKRLFYPKWWLQATGYFEHHGNFGPGVILFEPSPTADAASAQMSSISYSAAMVLTAVVSSILTVMGTLYYVRSRESKRHEYAPIPSVTL